MLALSCAHPPARGSPAPGCPAPPAPQELDRLAADLVRLNDILNRARNEITRLDRAGEAGATARARACVCVRVCVCACCVFVDM